MPNFFSKLFGGNKSTKDVERISPLVETINNHYASYASLSNDQLRNKTQEFKIRISEHLSQVDADIANINKQAEELPASEIFAKDDLYKQVDELRKKRNKEIEEILEEILPEHLQL